MPQEAPLSELTKASAPRLGAFRGREASSTGVSRKRLATMKKAGSVERVLPDTYRFTAVPTSSEQRLRAALAWAGPTAVGGGRSAGETYGADGVRATKPEIIVPRGTRVRSDAVIVHEAGDRTALMVRSLNGLPVTGVEATLLALAHTLGGEALEIACEGLRRRRLTSVPALRAYLDRFAKRGRPGTKNLRQLVKELDARNPSRSTLEVKARRLLVARGLTGFQREFPLEWNGRVHHFDFAFPDAKVILETNGRRWHDDPTDYEDDNEKWSVPGRHGFRIVFATWQKVVDRPDAFLEEIEAANVRSS